MTNEEMKILIIGDKEYEIVDEASRNNIGNLTALNTDTKANLVAAVNEHENQIGELTDLNTDTKTNLVAAVNEHESQLNNITVPTKISDLQNDSGFITSSALPHIEYGEIMITPTAADTITTGSITFSQPYTNKPVVIVSATTTVPEKVVCGCYDITTTGATIYMERTNTTNTYFDWIAIGV